MKTKNKLDFTNAVQEGMNEFHRLSGYNFDYNNQNDVYKKMTSSKSNKSVKNINKFLGFFKLFIK